MRIQERSPCDSDNREKGVIIVKYISKKGLPSREIGFFPEPYPNGRTFSPLLLTLAFLYFLLFFIFNLRYVCKGEAIPLGNTCEGHSPMSLRLNRNGLYRMLPFPQTYLGSPKFKKGDEKTEGNCSLRYLCLEQNSKHNLLPARLTLPHTTYLALN